MTKYKNPIKITATLVVMASIAIFYLAVNMMMSGIYNLKTQVSLDDWQIKQTTPNLEVWQNALQSSHNAQSYYLIKDAFLQENIGKVNQWRTYAQPISDQSVVKEREAALIAYRQQTKLTPNWPKAWFNLLSIKIELNQFDSEFYNAFNVAKQTTKQTPGMLTSFTLVGIQAYNKVNNSTKNKILKIIVNEAVKGKQSSQDLKPLLQAYNLLGITCVYAKAIKADTHKLCKL